MTGSGKILLVFAHPAYGRSRAGRALREAIHDLEFVTSRDLYELYPDHLIDVRAEQALLVAHDAVVFQHPFYWYSAPALIKDWLDLVLTHGFAYGDTGTALRGRAWLQAITTGGLDSNYQPDGSNRFTIDELLRPFEATAQLCGCVWQPPFVLHGGHLIDRDRLVAEARRYRATLTALHQRSMLANS